MYLLDTDTCIYALRGNPSVLENLAAVNRTEVALSVLTEAELRTGAAKSTHAGTQGRLENFLAPFLILDFERRDAVAYSQVRAALEKAGTPIGPLDTLLAGQAVARGLTLVTNNQREFGRVTGLNLASWT